MNVIIAYCNLKWLFLAPRPFISISNGLNLEIQGASFTLYTIVSGSIGGSVRGVLLQLFRLILPVLFVFVASLLAMTIVTFFLASSFDENFQATEQNLLSQQLKTLHERLRLATEDNAWWDEAVDNIYIEENTDWMRSVVGEAVWTFSDIDGVIIIRPDKSIIARYDGLEQVPDFSAMLLDGLGQALAQLDPTRSEEAISDSGYIYSNGELFVVAVSMVQPYGGKVYDPAITESARPVLVFYQRIDRDLALFIGNSIGLTMLEFSPTLAPMPAALGMTDIAQQPIGQFFWTAATPGYELLKLLVLPAILVLTTILGAMAVFVSRAKNLIEELKRADRAKTTFFASMSHELRTPLNAILGFIEFARKELPEDLKNSDIKDYLDIAGTSGDHLLTVINDILDISKLDAEKIEISAQAMDPTEVIEESARMMEIAANERSIELDLDLESSAIVSDERIVRQILINLLSNAIKFTEVGGKVSVKSNAMSGGYKIEITDTGVGMSAEEIEVALAPFGQVDNGHNNGGTGLGLPLVNRFLKLIGGTLTLRSAPGQGTSATIELPLKIDQ